MNKPPSEQIRFNLYLTSAQYEQVMLLREAGLSVSTIARQSVRKCCGVKLEPEDDTPRPERINLYLHNDDAAILIDVANRECCAKAEALRRLVDTYLKINSSAIKSLF